MARREVLVQLDDALVQELDRVAKDLGVSRSELLRRGARAALQVEDWAVADRALVEAYRRIPQEATEVEAYTQLATEADPE